MSQTLGEKLRQAREDKGLTLGDVAEQTRISSLYLEAIENDDYKILPGGIFNKGFIKSYAKFVGLSEQEALMDYQANLARTEGPNTSEQRVYKPEVLTDDNSGSMLPTILTAAIVLALLTGGILYLVSYLRTDSSTTASNTQPSPAANTGVGANTAATPQPESGSVPDMSTIKVEFKASQDVSLTATVDGKASTSLVKAGSAATYEPKESLKLSYSRSLASAVQLAINGKAITPPGGPLDPKRAVIDFTINRDNLAEIWNAGSITTTPPAAPANSNTISGVAPAVPTPKPTPKPAAAANTAAANTAKPPANATKPPTMTSTKPTPKPPTP